MPQKTSGRTPEQLASSKGGLIRAALAASPQAMTQAARDGRHEKRKQRVRDACPHITDEAEIERRAELLMRADMADMSLKAAKAKKLRAELAAVEAELNATGLDQVGSDGIDA